MKKHKKVIVGILVFCAFLLLTFLFIFLVNFNLKFSLIGNDKIELNYQSEYEEYGVEASIFKKDITDKVKITNLIQNQELGTYQVEYKLNILGVSHTLIRMVQIVDYEKPQITLKGKEEITLVVGDEYQEEGASAFDNVDGDISTKIEIENQVDTKKVGEYQVIYKVKDSSNNESVVTRKVLVTKKTQNIDIHNPMVKYIVDHHYDISFGYYNLKTKKSYFYNENKVYFAASLIKIVETLYLYDHDMVNADTKPYIEKIITRSDNPSHHYLQALIGQDNLKKYGASLGAKYVLSGGGVCGNTTVNDEMIFLKRLYEITKDGQNEELKSWFINDYGNHLTFDPSIPVMHKYGLYNQVYHDIGIVLDDDTPYLVVILTGIPDGYAPIVEELSKIIYEYHTSLKN